MSLDRKVMENIRRIKDPVLQEFFNSRTIMMAYNPTYLHEVTSRVIRIERKEAVAREAMQERSSKHDTGERF